MMGCGLAIQYVIKTKRQKNQTKKDAQMGRKQAFTHSYLGAMNTCPSESKLTGSRDSKSAIEREHYLGSATSWAEEAENRDLLG